MFLTAPVMNSCLGLIDGGAVRSLDLGPRATWMPGGPHEPSSLRVTTNPSRADPDRPLGEQG